MAKYKVENNTEKPMEKWETLMETNLEVRKAILELADNFKNLKALIIKNNINDDELNTIVAGVESTIREIAKEIDKITETHAVKTTDNGKPVIKFKAGDIDINNNNEVAVFISASQAYVGILEKIANVHQTGMMAILSRYAELTGETLPTNNSDDSRATDKDIKEDSNGESTTK